MDPGPGIQETMEGFCLMLPVPQSTPGLFLL